MKEVALYLGLTRDGTIGWWERGDGDREQEELMGIDMDKHGICWHLSQTSLTSPVLAPISLISLMSRASTSGGWDGIQWWYKDHWAWHGR